MVTTSVFTTTESPDAFVLAKISSAEQGGGGSINITVTEESCIFKQSFTEVFIHSAYEATRYP